MVAATSNDEVFCNSDCLAVKGGAERVDGAAEFGQAVVVRRQPLVEGAALVLELQAFGREPLGADDVVFLLLVEGGEFVAAVGDPAFQIDERGFGFVRRGVLLREVGVELPARLLLRVKFGLLGGEKGIDLLELGVEGL